MPLTQLVTSMLLTKLKKLQVARYICTHMRAYTRARARAHTHTHTHTLRMYVYTYVCVCVCVCVCITSKSVVARVACSKMRKV
jgi:hypothetical protein